MISKIFGWELTDPEQNTKGFTSIYSDIHWSICSRVNERPLRLQRGVPLTSSRYVKLRRNFLPGLVRFPVSHLRRRKSCVPVRSWIASRPINLWVIISGSGARVKKLKRPLSPSGPLIIHALLAMLVAGGSVAVVTKCPRRLMAVLVLDCKPLC